MKQMGEREKTCGLKIAHYRKKIKYTQEMFARVMGVSVPTLRNYENGKVVPSCEFLARFSTFMDLSPEIILRKREEFEKENRRNMFPDGEKLEDPKKKAVLKKTRYDI